MDFKELATKLLTEAETPGDFTEQEIAAEFEALSPPELLAVTVFAFSCLRDKDYLCAIKCAFKMAREMRDEIQAATDGPQFKEVVTMRVPAEGLSLEDMLRGFSSGN